jgi:quercetin dioxygenase-like cupin family protein
MKIVTWTDLPVINNPHHLDIRVLYDHPGIQIRQVVLQPGQRVRPFISPVTALLYICRGSVVVQSGDTIQSICKGKLVVCPAERLTTLFNNTDDEALVLAIRAPKPTEKSLLL